MNIEVTPNLWYMNVYPYAIYRLSTEDFLLQYIGDDETQGDENKDAETTKGDDETTKGDDERPEPLNIIFEGWNAPALLIYLNKVVAAGQGLSHYIGPLYNPLNHPQESE